VVLGVLTTAVAAPPLSGCEGTGSLVGATGGQQGTTPGTYTLTVSAIAGSVTELPK